MVKKRLIERLLSAGSRSVTYYIDEHPYLILALIIAAVTLTADSAKADRRAKRTVPATVITVKGAALTRPLIEAPSSVSVVTAKELERGGADFLQNQINDIPNFNWAGGTSRPRFFQLRGIGELEQYEGAPNSSVAVLLDGVDVTGVGAALTLFDIDQLEVHRGPQATRFGSSALAGAISLTTKQPTFYQSGGATLSIGSDDLLSGGLAFGDSPGEAFSNLSYRFALFQHRQDGFRNNLFLGRDTTNERSEFTGRGQLRYKLSPTSDLTLSLTKADLENGYDAFTIDNSFDTQSDRPGVDQESFELVSLRANAELTPAIQLTSITSFYQTDRDYSFDGDWGNNPFWEPNTPFDFFSRTDRERSVFAEQLEIKSPESTPRDSLRWLAGLFVQSFSEESAIDEFSDNIKFDDLSSNYSQDTVSGYAEIDIPLAESWVLGTGGRIERRQSYYSDSRNDRFSPLDVMLGGHLDLRYFIEDEQLIYTRISRGFRGGGFNPGASVPTDRRQYDPESLVNLELGHRGSFLGRRISSNTTFFANFRRDQQLKLGLQDDPSDPLSFTFVSDNAARGRSFGLESELTFEATERLTLIGSGGLL